MRVAVWGAGRIGIGCIRRLVLSPFVEELRWINRGLDKVTWRRIDLEHGLAYAPCCERVIAFPGEMAASALSSCDAVVLTHGVGVGPGETRADCYEKNREIFWTTCLPVLRDFQARNSAWQGTDEFSKSRSL